MLKRLIVLLIAFVLLLAAALLAAVLLIDPNDYRDRIAALVHEHTGRELRIAGDLRLSVFPWLGIETGELVLADAAGFGPAPFARVTRADIRVKLIPLLQRSIEVDTVMLEGLSLRLERDANGRANWEDLAGGPRADGRPADPGQAAGALPAALTIGGLDVRDSVIEWIDRSGGTHIQILALEMRSGQLEDGRPTDLALDFDLRSEAPEVGGHVDLKARITADFAGPRVTVENLRLDALLSGAGLPGGETRLTLRADLLADLPADTLEVNQLQAQAWGIPVAGEARVTGLSTAPRASGRLAIAEFDPGSTLKALDIDAGVPADGKALTRAALALGFVADADSAQLNEIDLRLDDTRVQGQTAVRSFTEPRIEFELAVDAIDIDRYLPEGEAIPPGGAAAAPAAAATLPVETLRSFDMKGRLSVGRLKASGLTIEQLSLDARADDGLIRMAPMTAALYGGRYESAFTLDARGDEPRIALDGTLTGVQAGPLIQDLMQQDLLRGTGNLKLALASRGADAERMRAALSGKGEFTFRDGAINGFNAAQMIRQAQALFDGGNAATTAVPQETDFTELGGTFTITDGVLRNDDLRGSSPWLRLGGEGRVDLVRENLDYRLRTRIVDTETGQGGAGLDELKGVDIPLRIHGPWAELQYSVDADFVGSVLRNRLLRELDKRTGGKAGEAQNKLQQQLQERLKGLFQ
ncbi:MAG: AsmA family protein [Gammaproteobacteria bacterium]|jgi:AsmA protein|nr:AsmA family protein [Gammaproteobacteria bacterium]